MSTIKNATLPVVGRIISCVKALSTTRVTFYSIVHDGASIEEIKAHIVDLGHCDVAITDHDDFMAQAFADNLPNAKAHRAPASESAEPNQPESGAPVQRLVGQTIPEEKAL